MTTLEELKEKKLKILADLKEKKAQKKIKDATFKAQQEIKAIEEELDESPMGNFKRNGKALLTNINKGLQNLSDNLGVGVDDLLGDDKPKKKKSNGGKKNG